MPPRTTRSAPTVIRIAIPVGLRNVTEDANPFPQARSGPRAPKEDDDSARERRGLPHHRKGWAKLGDDLAFDFDRHERHVASYWIYRSTAKIRSATSAKSAPTTSGRSTSGSSTLPGRATNAVAQPARAAPATSQACAAIRR